jgi:hypothetical protein
MSEPSNPSGSQRPGLASLQGEGHEFADQVDTILVPGGPVSGWIIQPILSILVKT